MSHFIYATVASSSPLAVSVCGHRVFRGRISVRMDEQD